MKTTKPFATISYNTDEFLKSKLDELFNKGIIEFYSFVYHYAEGEVENGVKETKDHIHLFIVPAELIDTIQLKTEFIEYDYNNDKPLCIINCVRSKFYDWFMYGLHDEKYLASKGQVRKYHYNLENFTNSDDDYLGQMLAMSDNNKINGTARFLELIKTGETFESLVARGFVPIQLINQYRIAYDMIARQLLTNNVGEELIVKKEYGTELDRVDGKHNLKAFNLKN